MAKRYIPTNAHVKLDSEMYEFLARLDAKLHREKGIKDALKAGTKILHSEFKKVVPVSKHKKTSGYLKNKSRVKVSPADRWGRQWMGRIVAPHMHLFEAGFDHKGPKPAKMPTSRGRVEGEELIPKLKNKHRRRIKAEMWRELKKFAAKVGRSGP